MNIGIFKSISTIICVKSPSLKAVEIVIPDYDDFRLYPRIIWK